MSQGTHAPEQWTRSPVDWPDALQGQYEDYASFFVPAELAEPATERNPAATETALVVETATRSSGWKDVFDPFIYVPFSLLPEDDARKHPWPVPALEIIEPSPPASIHGDTPPPASVTSGSPASLEQKQTRSVGVTWGEEKSHVYEVVAPLEVKEESIALAGPSKSRAGHGPVLQSEKPASATTPFSKSQARKSRRQFECDTHEHAQRALQSHCLHITQSKWVQDPNDPSEEIISLTSLETGAEAASAETSFRWVHVQRETNPISFEDFEDVLYKTPGLWDYEVAVASKCIKEVKLKRKSFARGKYYGPTVHQAHSVLSASAVEKVPVHATFLSMPVFAVLPCVQIELQNGPQPTASHQAVQSFLKYIFVPFGDEDPELPYWNNRDLRSSREHPIRSLLQYYNIVAIDEERDRRQVITKFARDTVDEGGYIHVPEFWALTINMYTIITCAPFSAEDLCGENIKIKPEAPKEKDQRIFVKYTNLQGRLHDFRCRTWFGLLDIVAGIEKIDAMQTLLNDGASEYKLIDLKFRPINEASFKEAILAEKGSTKVINVRLVRIIEDNPLTLAFAAKKLSDCVRDTIILMGLTGVLAKLKAQEVQLRKGNADTNTIDQHKARIKRSTEIVWQHHRSRMLNRLLLYAARCQILDPMPRRRERSGDRAEVRRIATREQGRERDFEQLHVTEWKQQGVKQSTMSTGGEKDTKRSPIPQIVIEGDTPEVIATPMLRQTTLTFHPLQRSHSSTLLAARAFNPVRKGHAPQPTLPGKLRDQYELPSGNDPLTVRRGGATQPRRSILSGRPRNSPGDLPRSVVATGLPNSSLPGLEAGGNRPLVSQRRHSTPSHNALALATVLPASPQRLPLRSEGDSAILRPSTLTDRIQMADAGANDQPLFRSSFAAPQTQDPDMEYHGPDQVFQTVSSQARRKSKERFSGPTPFFEIQLLHHSAENVELGTTGPSMATHRTGLKDDQSMDGRNRSTGHEGSSWDMVNDILSSIDDLICDGDFGKHSLSLASAIKPNHYNEIELESESDIISILQQSGRDEKRGSSRPPYQIDDYPQSEFLKAKIELFLGVHGLVGCFIHHEVRSEAKIVGKIWGIVYRICELNPHSIPASRPSSTALTLSPPKHDVQYVDLAGREIRRYEQKWKSLLRQIRDDTNGQRTPLKNQILQSLLPAFRNIVLFLLCALLAVNENAIDLDIFNAARDKLNDGIRESEAAFLRMTELAEMASDQIGDESIRTADTLLGLLLENAFSFSSRKHVDESGACGKMSLDIEHIYSTYTSRCIIRAKREASARLYEDVLLLKEEIEAIKLVLQNQGNLFQEALDTRESPPQNLDLRLNDRVIAKLQERAEHFQTLSEYAEQAETWTRNSIEVRGENNSKAIFIFTTVTIIFLPLSFISSVMSMNTIDVRQMEQGQWLFWAVAVPFTILVLLVCLYIVRYKFKLRRRFRTLIYWPLVRFRRPRDDILKAKRTYSDA